jgi:hypothetical protein
MVYRTRSCSLLLLTATLLLAENTPSWKTRPVEQWDNEDAKQILADSPWVGRATLQTIRDRSPAERRDSGDWNTAVGVGLADAAIFGSLTMAKAIERVRFKPSPGTVQIRWESARPVRAAEAMLGETPASPPETGFYVITLSNLFSRSEEISRRDRSIIFVTQIDRLFVAQFFYPGTMQIAGQLEL